MFDILLEEIRSFEDIAYLIARILEISKDKVVVSEGSKSPQLPPLPRELKDDDILCEVYPACGDLKLSLHVYRAEVDYKILASQVATAFKDFNTRGMMLDEDEPCDYEVALMFDQTGQAKKVKLIQSDEDYEQNIYHVIHQFDITGAVGSISISLGMQKSESSSHSQQSDSQGFSVTAGGKVNLTATGKGKADDDLSADNASNQGSDIFIQNGTVAGKPALAL